VRRSEAFTRVRALPLTPQRPAAQGDTRLALYGLGYMRDSRLYRMMTTTGDVTWRRPADAPGAPADSWFNLFFIHQNHAQRGSKSAVSEKQLPKWLNLVVWGHEHASKTEPTPSSEGTFDVSQPGSSVHTTLSEDEARPKKILLLTLKGEDWKTETLQLRTVRPFVFENVALRDEPTLASRPDDAEGVSRFLHAAVEAAIVRANAQATEFDGAGGASAPPPDATAGGAAAPPAVLPLVRVRVDHSGGFPTVPLQRFGAAFQGRVANPWDLLQFHKCATKRAKMERGSGAEAAAAAAEEAPGTGEANEHRRIDALVTQHLPAQLQILTEADMALALEDFVQRDEKNALADAVKAALDESQRKVAAHGMPAGAVDDPSEVLKTIKVVVQEMNAAKPARAKPARAADADGAGAEGGDVDMTGEDDAPPARAKTAAKPRAKAAAATPKAAKGKQATVAGLFGRATATATADGDGGAAASEEPSPAKRPPARRAAAAKKTYAESDEDGDADGDEDFAAGKRGASEDESDGDDAIDEDAEESPRPKRKAAPAARGAGRGKGKAAASGAGAKRGRAAVEEPVEIEDRCVWRGAFGGKERLLTRVSGVLARSDDDDAPKPKAARGAARAAPPSVAASAPSQPQTNATATARGWGSMRR
jgi:double-strand break repair protein MRE11